MVGVSLVGISVLDEDDDGDVRPHQPNAHGNAVLGFLAVISAAFSSGFAGVYFEKMLKGTNIAVWVRNMELAFVGIIVGLVGVYLKDLDHVTEVGFLFGYNSVVWATISLQAFGGLGIHSYCDEICRQPAQGLRLLHLNHRILYPLNLLLPRSCIPTILVRVCHSHDSYRNVQHHHS